MYKKLSLLSLVFILTSCAKFLQTTDDEYYKVIDNKTKSESLDLIFSHNINGETHPCGCRNFPLGGLPQVAGILHELQTKSPVIYVDSGDAFFPSTKVPALLENSQLFTAKKIAESFDINKLDFFLPGDQDFAYGEDFLAEISHKHKFQFLISNIKDSTKIKHKKWIAKRFGNQTLVFLGILDPSLLQNDYRSLFIHPTTSLKLTLNEISKKLGSSDEIKVILLSHSGMEADKKIAQQFPEIDWIIGAHSQAFTQLSVDINNTKLVQVLSRNHYLGEIKIAAHKKSNDVFKVIEIRDELKDKWKNNPMLTWLDKYKTELDKIQLDEQKAMIGTSDIKSSKAQTAQSCIQCHTEQGEFWQKTSHSIAFATLDNAKSSNNPNCIGCHSLNYKSLDGFQNTDDMVVSAQKLDDYWKEWESDFKKIKSVRKLSSTDKKHYSDKWMKLDTKFEVKHNFANVQCLNCHDKAHDHPFEMEEVVKKTTNFQAKCIKCHTNDQSPEWYNKDDKGIATSVNNAYFAKTIKKVACPKRKE